MKTRLRSVERQSRAHSRRRGTTMVETGAAIIVLLMMTLGLIQYGMLYNAALSLNNLAREGARFAAVRVKSVGNKDTMRAQVCAHLQGRARGTSIEPGKLTPSQVTVEWAGLGAGQQVRVAIAYDLRRNKSFAPDLLPLPARYSQYQATASNLIE